MNLDRVLRLFGMRYASAALMLVAVAALYGAAAYSRPGEAAEKGGRAPVTSAVLVCPGHEGGRLAVQSAGEQRGAGRADMAPTKGGSALATMTSPGQGWGKDTTSGDDSYTLRATGALAAGLEAEQTTDRGSGDDRGLAGARCAAPATDTWFIGPGPDAADQVVLYLTNVDSQPASVDLAALSGEGPLDTVEGRGTRVDPYTTKVVRIGESDEGLGSIVKSAADLALRVRTTSGRIAASLRVRAGKGKGVEWVPASPAPAASVIVPGLPGGTGARRLLVSVPGDADAQVRVQVVTKDGTFVPAGQDVLDAPAKTVTSLALDGALSGRAAAVRLVSDRPVLAGFAAERGADVAYGAAAAPLGAAGPGIVADNRFDSTLVLSAPAGAATVQVTTVNAQGRSGPQEIGVPAGHTVESKLAAPSGGGSFGVIVTPKAGSGPVYAARTLSKGKGDEFLFTVLPIVPAVTTIDLPGTADSQSALTPG
ncbi:DUF5719 family protein [Actinomadura decatromicini]|uniref:Secreted protein n=1 Tax=Actinomadura decatromicini TaxID=2604572 RepID=A0A5D3G1R7_9ACTN|nr:DUF5719 family protein [Actinomadura decatromicini]TYK53485.1 hypothetical protein FXF68_07300 [Actinomadura decatromicini]